MQIKGACIFQILIGFFMSMNVEAQTSLDDKLQSDAQAARILGRQQKFTEAHQKLNQIEKSLTTETPVAEVRYNLERGRVYNSAGNVAQALPYFQTAYDLSIERNLVFYAADAAHMLAIADKNLETKIKWNLETIKLAQSASDDKTQGWIGTAYNNMGFAYHDEKKYPEALAAFQEALRFYESKTRLVDARIAKWTIAFTYRFMEKYDEAIQLQSALEKEWDEAGEKDAYVYEELGELYLLKNNASESKKYFGLAYEQFVKDESFQKSYPERFQRIKELSLNN